MKWKFLVVFICLCLFVVGVYIRNSSNGPPPSQMSNNSLYLGFCEDAISDVKIFSQFKRHPIYNLFEEGLTFEEGVDHLKTIEKQTPELLEQGILNQVRKLDCVGRPHVHSYGMVGPFSSTTLFYLKIASDLKRHFGEMSRLSIIEINGGNGGLCKVLHDVFDIEHYTIIDLEEPAKLAKKHLAELGLHHIQFVRPDDLRLMQCDLLISYDGLCEADDKLQKRYIKKLFPGADRGYFICNFYPQHFGLKCLKKQQLLDKIRGKHSIELHPEQPLTGKENCIITWRDI